MRRAHDDINPICRACSSIDETLGHVLGQCITTKAKRIKRHNEIVDLLKDRLAATNRVLVEPTVEHNGERFKPDFVITNEERVIVLDVTVRYKNRSFLTEAAKEKIDKYSNISNKLKRNFNAPQARVVPIVVGSRGALPAATIAELKQLNIRKTDWLTISLIALKSSIEIANAFMNN
ncbi:r2 protein [Lasius niger]|uniref:R2 protein n=1 Tax=Lasius niger TaxID=67767 RepID=A0A0J7MSA5_LASNI|nr:r2 protein [Lasius niger]